MRDKKAVELSMNTIIIAAIALLVLIILALIVSGQMGKLMRSMKDCEQKGGDDGDCTKDNGECVDRGGTPSGGCVFYDKDGRQDSRTIDGYTCCVYKKG